MDLLLTIGGSGDTEPDINLANIRELAKEPILNAHILSTCLQALANLFLVGDRSNTLNELLEPSAAAGGRVLDFSCRITKAGGGLLGDGVAQNGSLDVGDEEEEGQEEGHGEEEALHG